MLGSVTADGQHGAQNGSWTLLTGHGHVLIEIARDPEARMRDISLRAGITERAVQLIVADLEEAGYLIRHRQGRRNRYVVNPDSAYRHPAQDGHRVGPLLDLLAAVGKGPGRSRVGDARHPEADVRQDGSAEKQPD
jgi:hypothetical protein